MTYLQTTVVAPTRTWLPAATPTPAKFAVMALHKEIAACEPDKHLARLGLLHEVTGYDGDLDSLRLTWDPQHTTLLRKEQYQAALHLIDASPDKRNRCAALYQLAQKRLEHETPGIMASTQRYRIELVRDILERTPNRGSMPELASLDTEQAFMAHLNTLKARSGKGYRPIASEMRRLDPKNSRAHATLAALFGNDTVPSNENLVRLLLTVLLSSNTTAGVPKESLDEHMRIWRTLIARRTAVDVEPHPLAAVLTLLATTEEHVNQLDKAYFGPGLRLAQRLITEKLRGTSDEQSDTENTVVGARDDRWLVAEGLAR